jgi:hypothetical protein
METKTDYAYLSGLLTGLVKAVAFDGVVPGIRITDSEELHKWIAKELATCDKQAKDFAIAWEAMRKSR